MEEDPTQMPELLGESVSTSNFVDSDYASNVINGRSYTGILLFVINGMIKDFGKSDIM